MFMGLITAAFRQKVFVDVQPAQSAFHLIGRSHQTHAKPATFPPKSVLTHPPKILFLLFSNTVKFGYCYGLGCSQKSRQNASQPK
jgi:mannitol-specific phosphotransferase system IIBC component